MADDAPEISKTPAQRLCSEIQLFDLCDLDSCRHKNVRFCTNDELLRKFESIKDEEAVPELVYDEDEFDSDDESDFEEFNEDFEGDDE